jgi:hypothetical protein
LVLLGKLSISVYIAPILFLYNKTIPEVAAVKKWLIGMILLGCLMNVTFAANSEPVFVPGSKILMAEDFSTVPLS